MKASYVSTGAGGTDYEVDVAAACLVRLLTETSDRLIPVGYTLTQLGLQDRSGPTGFDDLNLLATDAAGDSIAVYVQAKRSFTFAPSGDFSALVQAIAACDQDRPEGWQAALVVGQSSLSIEDVQVLLDSARKSPDAPSFIKRWETEGVTNRPKREFLSMVRTALSDDENLSWRVMRHLTVLQFDYHLVHSRDRDAALAAFDGRIETTGGATALFGGLRDLVLRNGKLAAQWTRSGLIAELGAALFPSRRAQGDLDVLGKASAAALNDIPTHIEGSAPAAAVSLLRNELYADAKALLSSERCVRLCGEGGSGKSGMLGRLAAGFDGRVLVLKDDRIVAHDWDGYVSALGAPIGAQLVVDELATSGPCLLAIDGADRLLLSRRRGVLRDIVRAIAASPLRDRWSIVTSARDYQTSDLVAELLRDTGLPPGQRCEIGSLDAVEIELLGSVFPAIAALARRGDLGNRNRILFLLREVLASPNLPAPYTEIGLAAAWATRGTATGLPQPERARALAEMGELLLSRPDRRPGREDIDPVGLETLSADGVIRAHPTRDVLVFAHDVHEDWVLARAFERHRADLARLIVAADQPLWWLRAMRLVGQMLLEDDGDHAAWLALLEAISAEPSLDPSWARSLLVAPLYSERSGEILDALEGELLAGDGLLLQRLLDTLLVYETRLEAWLLKLPAFAEMGELERLRSVAGLRFPQWRSWLAFLVWSLRKWRQWPAFCIPQLSEVGETWVFATEGSSNSIAKAIVEIAREWLIEVEDARHTHQWSDHRTPFGLEGITYDAWKKIEARLRRTLKMGVEAAPEQLDAYLARLVENDRLDAARGDLIDLPRRVPTRLPHSYVDVAIAHFVPRRRRRRRDDQMFQPDCFSTLDYRDAGIAHEQGFFPSSPLRGGFTDLFARDEGEALRLFHRLEIRAAVYYRHSVRYRDGRRARSVQLQTTWGVVPLWGDENVYRWARGILGSSVLGSAYLALDEWLFAQAAAGRPLQELFQLVLQPNGLVATASPCINLLFGHINTPGQIDAATPFLGAPRLWHYDLRRFMDDQSNVGTIGFRSRDIFFEATQRVGERYKNRRFLAHDLLLPFQLKAGSEAREHFGQQRAAWTPSVLAAFEDEIGDADTMAAFEDQLTRHRSDSDLRQISVAEAPNGEGVIVQIEPPAEAIAHIEQLNRNQGLVNDATRLSMWVSRSREKNALQSTLTLSDAIALAGKLEAVQVVDDPSSASLFWHYRASGVVGTAALIARYGSDGDLDQWLEWARARILAACRIVRSSEDERTLIDQAKLFDDPQLLGADGLSAMINRGKDMPGDRDLAIELATNRLHSVAAAVVHGLDWQRVQDFAWRTLVAAFDMCVRRYGRPWIDGDEERALEHRRRDRQQAIAAARRRVAKAPASPPPPYVNRWIWQRAWRWPVRRIRVRSKRLFDWNLAQSLLTGLDYHAIAGLPEPRVQFARYLERVIDWAYAYSEDKEADRYRADYPYELMHEVARAAGRLAAAGGSCNIWERFKAFDRRDYAADLIGTYMDAIAVELVRSERAPDERFWLVWRPPADFVVAGIRRPPRYRSDFDRLTEASAAAGFVGPYMSPIPPAWPYLEMILPAIDRWATAAAYSFAAANSLLRFSERFDADQRRRWLVRWVGLYVEEHRGDQSFWGYGSNGDRAAALLEMLTTADATTRREVRRLLGVIADGGSLAARDVLGRFSSGRE